MDDYGIKELMWLRSAMGALYYEMTPEQVTDQLLQDNIIKPDKETASREFIDKLYDLSNQFLHGEYNIWHPSEDDNFDHDLDKDMYDLSWASSFSLSVIIAAIQKRIVEYAKSNV